MSPKEKAIELVNMFQSFDVAVEGCKNGGNSCISINKMFQKSAIKCALICVDEILDALSEYDNRNNTYELQNMERDFNYWEEVRKIIKINGGLAVQVRSGEGVKNSHR